MTKEDLKKMQSWNLGRKIQVSQTRILEWLIRHDDNCYISFSGGKDSTVLLDLVRRVNPNVKAVFVDTGLEFPEIRRFVKTIDNVVWLKPEKRFDQIVKEYGYPVISKEVSKIIYGARHGMSETSIKNYKNKMLGLNPDGTESAYKARYKKYAYLLDAPFEISNRCCYFMKEKPCIGFERETKLKPIIGTMAEESLQRQDGWLKTGCNAFQKQKGDREISKPLSFWTEQDILNYLVRFDIPYASIYGSIEKEMTNYKRKANKLTGKLKTAGEQRTGCMGCIYGCHLDKTNRFQRMKETHPKHYDYYINRLGMDKVLDYIGVEY